MNFTIIEFLNDTQLHEMARHLNDLANTIFAFGAIAIFLFSIIALIAVMVLTFKEKMKNE